MNIVKLVAECRKTLDDAIDADAEAWHQRAASRAAALNGHMTVVVEREEKAVHAEKRLSVALEHLDELMATFEHEPAFDSGSARAVHPETCAPGLVGEAVAGYVTDTVAVTRGGLRRATQKV